MTLKIVAATHRSPVRQRSGGKLSSEEVNEARLKHSCVEGYQGRNLTQKPSGLCQGEVAFGADLGCSSSYSIEVGDLIICLKTGVWSRFSCQQLLNKS